MGWFCKEFGPRQVDFWKVVGLLHDLDFHEKYPEQHCVKAREIMRENAGIDRRIIRATTSHAYPAVDYIRRSTSWKRSSMRW